MRRYDRLPLSITEREYLHTARLLLLGAGAVGANVGLLLLRCGVASKSPGMLYVVDGDRVSEENRASQPYFYRQCDCPKVDAFRELAEQIAPQTNGCFWARELDGSDIDYVSRIAATVDLVLFAIDSFDLVLRLSDAINAPQVAAFLGPRGAEAEVAFFVPGITPPLRSTLARSGGLSRLPAEQVLPTRVLATAAYVADVVVELLLSRVERSKRRANIVPLFADCPVHVLGFERSGLFTNRPCHETRSVLMVQKQ